MLPNCHSGVFSRLESLKASRRLHVQMLDHVKESKFGGCLLRT